MLENRFRGIAAIVVAAGPSVEQDLALLKRHSSSFIIIAVDTVLNTLLNRGLKPDIVVTVDPQLINSFHLSSLSTPLEAEQLPILVADPAVYPTALRSYRGDILITSSVFNPGRIIEQFSERKGTIAAGGSVATAAFDLARLMGTDPVILMGLDLSFSGLKTHISGSYVERYIHNNAYRLKTITTYTASYIRGGNPALFHNKAGVPVLSDSRMQLYKNWFERQMVHQKATVLNASRRGLAIEGIPDIAPESIPTHVPNGVDKEKILEDVRILMQSSEIQFEKAALFMEYLALRHGDLERVESLAHRAAETAESLKDEPSPEKAKTLSSLETQIVSFADCSRLIDMVMQEPINETLSQKAAGDMKLLLSRSITLYRAIEEASIFLQELLAETMERLKLKQQLQPPSHDAI
jgi:hypothetical protein